MIPMSKKRFTLMYCIRTAATASASRASPDTYVAANITRMANVNQLNSTVLKCPVGLDSRGILEIDTCRQMISTWDDAICESMLDASQEFYCPYKDCSSWMVNDCGETIREAECLSCRRLFFVQCNAPWHSGVGCEEFKGMDENERGMEDLMVHQLAKEKKRQRQSWTSPIKRLS